MDDVSLTISPFLTERPAKESGHSNLTWPLGRDQIFEVAITADADDADVTPSDTVAPCPPSPPSMSSCQFDVCWIRGAMPS